MPKRSRLRQTRARHGLKALHSLGTSGPNLIAWKGAQARPPVSQSTTPPKTAGAKGLQITTCEALHYIKAAKCGLPETSGKATVEHAHHSLVPQ